MSDNNMLFSLFSLPTNSDSYNNNGSKFLGTYTSESFALDGLKIILERILEHYSEKWNNDPREKERQKICQVKWNDLRKCEHSLESYNKLISDNDFNLISAFKLDPRRFIIFEHRQNEVIHYIKK